MKKLDQFSAFLTMKNYLQSEIESYEKWSPDVKHVLSGTDLTTWTDNKPADITTWYAWKNVASNTLAQLNKELSKDENLIYINSEQAYMAMNYFLNDRYWKKKPTMLLTEAVEDLQNVLDNKNLETSEVWQEWLTAVKKSLEFQELFEQ